MSVWRNQHMDIEVPGGTVHLDGWGDVDAGDFAFMQNGPNDDGFIQLGLGRAWRIVGFTPAGMKLCEELNEEGDD